MLLNNLHIKLTELGKTLKLELQKELQLQKHRASGNLSDSVEMQVSKTTDGVILKELHDFYGDFVDRGRKAGGKRVPIAVLEAWVRLKGFAPSNERNVAFAIQNKIFKEGIPTSKSRTIAPRRLNWLTGTLEQNAELIGKTVEESLILEFNFVINDLLAKTNARIKAQA